jgi:hypothetical protein
MPLFDTTAAGAQRRGTWVLERECPLLADIVEEVAVLIAAVRAAVRRSREPESFTLVAVLASE